MVPEHIKELYLQFGDDWQAGFARIAVETIKESSIYFYAKDYFIQRNQISEVLLKAMQDSFDEKAEKAVQVGTENIFVF